MSTFKTELVTSRPVAERLLEKAGIEKIKVEKKLGNSVIKSYTASQSLTNRLEDKAEWEKELAKATADVNNLPAGPAKDRAVVDQQEFQWRLNKMNLAENGGDNPEDIVWAEYEKSVGMAVLPKTTEFIAEMTARRDSLPA